MTTQTVLTDEQMTTITTLIAASNEPVVDALKATYDILLAPEGRGWDSFDENNRLTPWEYEIPEPQWHAICTALLERGDALNASGITRVNLALDWMNSGPAAYTP